ncbi:uncharacterized protein BDR25DRAFT_102990 [Lindgomyces ingoldianus]|uniref:Uncharacterized protein n=1 Tax=Lindgomyces ingoldianus TaxID=673940 RepID=A0ACB6R8G5_9PLEO|nr:uncharacterized protein BDR25DRAFT_102990 [Lindgomyces ingoldianus]KAF2475471.1 hypothetical protein BDR25DRAFT_102990 [Lindgomyces ingoldianus]
MRFTTASVIALATSVSAVGNAVVKNNCNEKIYVNSVGSSVGPQSTLSKGQTYLEVLHRDPTAGGIAIKITKVDSGLYSGAPQQIFSYSLDGAQVWYDLSAVMGEPFHGEHVTVTSNGCGTIDWPNGSNPGGSQVKVCGSGNDVVFTACA